MSLQGLPDFQRPLNGYKFQIFAPFENQGDFVVASSALELGTRTDGRPDFRLEMVRGTSPLMPPKPYSVLDFRVRAAQPLAEALSLIRQKHPRATVRPPSFRGGFLRFHLAADTGDLPEELLRPVPLTGNGLGVTRFTIRLSTAAGAFIEAALHGEVLGLLAWAELEMLGVAPRVPVSVVFDPAELLGALAKLAAQPSAPVLTRDAVEDFFEQDLTKLPVKVEGTLPPASKRHFVDAMADLVRLRYAEMIASPAIPVEFSMALQMEHALPGRVSWDLRESMQVSRTLLAGLDPFDAVRQLGDVGSFIKQTIVPPLGSGTRLVQVSANLPEARAGVVAIGVDLIAPPNPPARPRAVQQTIEFQPPSDEGVATLKLAVGEPLAYDYVVWAAVERNGAVERKESGTVRHGSETLDLSVENFPVRFVTFGAAPSLLAVANVTGTCKGRGPQSGAFEAVFHLSAAIPSVGVAVPSDVELLSVPIEAQETGSDRRLAIEVNPGTSGLIDLPSFPQFGPHTVEIEGDFSSGASLLAVDLAAEDKEDRPAAIQSVFVTPATPRKQWSYLAESPFRAGYRFRVHGTPGEPPRPWSEVQPPGTSLRLSQASHRSFQTTEKES